jgi:ribosomal protein S18 acetylase RimI-like enzyme
MPTRMRWATVEDVPFLVEVVMLSSRSHVARGAWDVVFPDDALRERFLGRLLGAATRCWCHWSNFLLAEVDGRPAAALAGYVERDEGMAGDDEAIVEAATAVGIGDGELATGFERVGPFVACLPEKVGRPWIVEWVATLPAHRRRGLVYDLLCAMLAEGRRRGHAEAQISILIGNVAAERAYERVGFRHRDERRSEAFERLLACPGVARLWMTLG